MMAGTAAGAAKRKANREARIAALKDKEQLTPTQETPELEIVAPTATPVAEPVYVAAKKITVRGKVYKPGEVVPDAKDWLRVDSWVRARHIILKDVA